MSEQRHGNGSQNGDRADTSATASAHAAPPQPPRRRPHPAKTSGRHLDKLTPQQDRFCLEYVKDLNATQAAIRAGYSRKSASSQGVELLSYPKVIARLTELQSARIERLQVDADFVLARLVDEVQARAADIYDAETGALLPVHQWPEVWQRGLVTNIQTTELYAFDKEGKQRVIGHAKTVVFADRVKRLELLGKHINVQAFRERVGIGADSPLSLLFKEIQGQAIRPAIEHQPRTHEEDAG